MNRTVTIHDPARLQALRIYNILDTAPERAYDDLAHLASMICRTPVALVSLVDRDRLWFKARVGLDATEISNDQSFCAYAISQPDRLFVVPNAAQDPRFCANPLVVSEPFVRFYAGAPLATQQHDLLGTLCVIDTVPRELDAEQLEALAILSRQVVTQLELRRKVTELEESERRLEAALAQVEELSTTDALTGLNNRRAFERRLAAEFEGAKEARAPLSFLIVDVDNFKEFNDTLGHLAGDELLKTVAILLKEYTRANDVVARYGGDELAVILPHTGKETALQIADRLRSEAERRFSGRVTLSIGAATLTSEMSHAEALLAAADGALYRAKDSGRNRVCCAA
jgi:diguanylate cyclase (GGDEF)-like protein